MLRIRGFSAEQLPVTQRLTLINGLLLIALVIVAMISWRANDAQRKAMADLALISRAARYHQDADTQNANLRADVNEALGSAAYTSISRDSVLASLADDSEALRRDIRDLDRIELPPDVAESLGRVRDLEDAYRIQASDAAKAILSNTTAGYAQMPQFNASYEALQEAMLKQTGVLARRIVASSEAADAASQRAKSLLLTATILTSLVVCTLVALLSISIRQSLRRVRDVAQAIAAGNLAARADSSSGDEVGSLAVAMNQLAVNLGGMMDRLQADSERDAFGRTVVEALDMADTEAEAYSVVSRVMAKVAPEMPMELLIADSSRAHLERATEHPVAGSPGCSVESPFSCVAVRRGTVATFPDGEAVNACPRLRGRPGGEVSAVCVPLSFMGRSLGVLHAAAARAAPATATQVAQLGSIAQQTASRVGTLRAFRRTQIQASTDSLTGLVNRRTIEEHIRKLNGKGASYAFVLCDLDHFKKLNDNHGHQVGDMALRLFADVLRGCMRDDDMPARWGGEEFVIILANCNAAQALDAVRRIQSALAQALLAGTVPAFASSYGISDTTMASKFDEIARLADNALYQAKEQGRDRAVIANGPSAALVMPRRDAEHLAAVDMDLMNDDLGPLDTHLSDPLADTSSTVLPVLPISYRSTRRR